MPKFLCGRTWSDHRVLAMALIRLFVIIPEAVAERPLRLRKLGSEAVPERYAFDLVRLERKLDVDNVRAHPPPTDSRQSFRDEPDKLQGEHGVGIAATAEGPPTDACRQRCNEQLRMGLDMVKAHSGFGSIGVPSVLDALDLQMFCRVDSAHDQCLFGCGYQVQFNMRDFVCKHKRKELLSHLDCYAHAAPQLRRHCGPERCGPYAELELSLLGVSQRCRTLLCDLQCMRAQFAAHAQCRDRGRAALQYLTTYSQIQVLSWLHELLAGESAHPGGPFWRAMPRSCLRLVCGPDAGVHNCTLPSL